MSPEPNLARLGKLSRERRAELDHLTVKEASLLAGISDTTWTSIEAGKPASDKSYAGMDVALGWQPGSATAVLAGRDPDVDELGEARVRSFHRPGRQRDRWTSMHDTLIDYFESVSLAGKDRIVEFAQQVVEAERQAIAALSGNPEGVQQAPEQSRPHPEAPES